MTTTVGQACLRQAVSELRSRYSSIWVVVFRPEWHPPHIMRDALPRKFFSNPEAVIRAVRKPPPAYLVVDADHLQAGDKIEAFFLKPGWAELSARRHQARLDEKIDNLMETGEDELVQVQGRCVF